MFIKDAIAEAVGETLRPRWLNNTLAGGMDSPYTAIFSSGSRVAMKSSQITQITTLLEGDPLLLHTGFISALRNTTWAIRTPCRLIVKKIQHKYKNSRLGKDARFAELDIYYQEIRNDRNIGHLGIITIPATHTKHVKFGFTYKRTSILNNIRVGDELPKGAVLADSPAVNHDTGDYYLGRRLNLAYVPDPATHEDGVVLSDTAAQKFTTEHVTFQDIPIDTGQTLLNRFGTADYYQCLPKIGDYIPDGVLAIVRTLDAKNYFAAASRSGLGQVDEINDFVVNCPLNARVTDIQVMKNTLAKNNSSTVPDECRNYLDAYFDAYLESVQAADDWYEEMRREAKRNKLPFVPHPTLLIKAGRTHSHNKETFKTMLKTKRPTMARRPINEYFIRVKLATKVVPTRGFKFSGQHGDKFVVTEVRKEEHMPIDAFGRRAEILVDPRTVVARNNPGQLHEQFLHDALWHTRQYLLKLWTESDVETTWKELLNFASRVSTPWFELLGKVQELNQKVQYLNEELRPDLDKQYNTISVYTPVDTPELGDETIQNLKDTPFYPKRDKITVFTHDGKMCQSRADIRIAERYLFMLEKDASDLSAVSAPRRQVMGLSAKQSTFEKRADQISKTPVRQYGESEVRALYYVNGKMAARQLALINNPTWFRAQIHAIFNREGQVANMGNYISTDVVRQSRGVEVFSMFNSCFGVKMKRSKVDA